MNDTSRHHFGLLALASIFLLTSSTFAKATETGSQDDSASCPVFLQKTRFLSRNLRLFRFNTAETERVLNEVSGVQFVAGDMPIIPSVPGEAPKAAEDKSVKRVQDWFDRYAAYLTHLERIQRSIGRYLGEDPLALLKAQGLAHDPSERDAEDDDIRKLGRIKIFETALEQTAPQGFPITLKFPRAPRRQGSEVLLQRTSSLLVQKTFRSQNELRTFLSNDSKELLQLEGLLVERELEQAELFVRIRMFFNSFPPGAQEKLAARLQKADSRRAEAVGRGETVPDPRQDPALARDYLVVALFQRASDFLNNSEDKFSDLRPTQRSIEFIEELTSSGTSPHLRVARTWEPLLRRHVEWSYDWMAAVNKWVALARQPIVTYSGVVIIASAALGASSWTWNSVLRPSLDYVFYDPTEAKAREYVHSLQKLRETISDTSVTHRDFYGKFFAHAQAKYSDEAITIAFEYLRKIRPTPEATSQLDPGFKPEQLASFTRQAKQIVDERDALLFGYKSRFGDVPGVNARLDRREMNYFLAEDLWKGAIKRGPPSAAAGALTDPALVLPKPAPVVPSK